MLRRVNLSGVIGECVLEEGEKGFNHIQAIDLTNSLILSINAKTKFTDFGKLGIGDLSTLCKYLDSTDDTTEMKVSENRLLLKNNSGSFKYLLSDPELIPTIMEDKDAIEKLVKGCTHEIQIEEESQKRFLTNIGLTKTNSVSIQIKKNSLWIKGGLETEHQFSINMGKVSEIKDAKNDEFTIPVFGSHLAAVMSVLDWSTENLPKLLVKEGRPVIIQQNKDIWCLTVVGDK